MLRSVDGGRSRSTSLREQATAYSPVRSGASAGYGHDIDGKPARTIAAALASAARSHGLKVLLRLTPVLDARGYILPPADAGSLKGFD